MSKIRIGELGFSLAFTAKLPPDAQKLLKERGGVAAFDLTPYWGEVPGLLVADLRRSGVNVPGHWDDYNTVYPQIHGMSFYIQPTIPTGCAASFSMNGVNIRTGKKEDYGHLTDEPCQSYWSKSVPWIDGYVPSHGQAVRQFVPLRGEAEMARDVARHVGIKDDNPFRDGITMTTFLPRDITKLQPHHIYNDWGEGLESVGGGFDSMSYGAKGLRGLDSVEHVGMGAGALMGQKHEDNPLVKADDYFYPLPTLVARFVWDDTYNQWAHQSGEQALSGSTLRQLEDQQRSYEASIWSRLGGKPKTTNVDTLPGW